MAMLQLGGATVRITPRVSWWLTAQHLLSASSMATSPNLAADNTKDETVEPVKERRTQVQSRISTDKSLITAAFKSLMDSNKPEMTKINEKLNKKIHEAKNVDDLLNTTKNRDFNQQNASAVIYMLCNWVTAGKVRMGDIQNDRRYMKVCSFLGIERHSSNLSILGKTEDNDGSMSPLYGLLETEKAKKQINRLEPAELITVLLTLASKQRRTTPLLKLLSSKLVNANENFNIKQLADILYGMAVLTYYDEELMKKTTQDLLKVIPKNKKASVIGSILTSVGLLRYRDEELLNMLSNWVVEHREIIRPQEITSLLMTLAYLGYTPANFDQVFEHIIQPLKESDMCQSSEWLDIVWALTVLNKATPEHYESVLNSSFMSRLFDLEQWPARTLKLLNINAAARLLQPEYKGSLIPENSALFGTTIAKTKDKTELTNAIVSALKILLPSDSIYLNVNVNTEMGFMLDAEFCVDSNCTPLPVNSKTEKDKKVYRIGVLTCAYHEFCRGTPEMIGPIKLFEKLILTQGYKVMLIPYTKVNVREKLVTRVKYINDNIKLLIKDV